MRAVCILCGLLLAFTAPAIANDVESRACVEVDAELFKRGQTLYRSGQFTRAHDTAMRLCECFPANVDYQYLRALALNALGRGDEALAAARTARSLAPDYREVAAFVERLARQQQAPEKSTAPVAGGTRWSFIGALGAHELTNGRDGWNEQSLTALAEYPGGRVAEWRVDREARGNASDASFSGRMLWPIGGGRRVSVGLMLTPSATFRPEQLLTLQAEQDLPSGWVARAGVNHRGFSDDRSDGLSVSADRYFAAFRFSFGLNLARLDSAGSALSQVASVDWYQNERHRYRLTLGNGRELDTIDDGTRVLESRVRSLTLSGQHQLNPRLGLGWWLGTLEQGEFYDRRYAGFSVTRRY